MLEYLKAAVVVLQGTSGDIWPWLVVTVFYGDVWISRIRKIALLGSDICFYSLISCCFVSCFLFLL